MGRRGPPRKPTALLKLAGSEKAAKREKAEPVPTTSPLACPQWISADAKEEWGRIVPELERLGLLTLVDSAALVAYCQSYAELKWSTETLEKEGRVIVVETKFGTRSQQHPACIVQKRAFDTLKVFAQQFGLSPASRSNVTATPQDKANGKSRFFKALA